MAETKMQMPGVFGGLMRYDEEYKSRFMLSPAVVIGFIIAIIILVIVLKIFFPIAGLGGGELVGGAPVHGGLALFGFWRTFSFLKLDRSVK
jgi:preprotein translocase subunit Sec61beta